MSSLPCATLHDPPPPSSADESTQECEPSNIPAGSDGGVAAGRRAVVAAEAGSEDPDSGRSAGACHGSVPGDAGVSGPSATGRGTLGMLEPPAM